MYAHLNRKHFRDLRSETRFDVSSTAVVVMAGAAERFEASVRDISRNGMRIVMPLPVEAGSLLLVNFGGTVIVGEVRWCYLVAAEHFVGVRVLDAMFEASDFDRMPAHLAMPPTKIAKVVASGRYMPTANSMGLFT